MMHPVRDAGGVVIVVTLLAFAAQAGVAHAQSANDTLSLSTGDERWQESRNVTIIGRFACDSSKADYSAVIDRDVGVTTLKVSVNGKPVDARALKSASTDIAAARGYDYASFSCTATHYRFSFLRATPGKRETIVSMISGTLK